MALVVDTGRALADQVLLVATDGTRQLLHNGLLWAVVHVGSGQPVMSSIGCTLEAMRVCQLLADNRPMPGELTPDEVYPAVLSFLARLERFVEEPELLLNRVAEAANAGQRPVKGEATD